MISVKVYYNKGFRDSLQDFNILKKEIRFFGVLIWVKHYL